MADQRFASDHLPLVRRMDFRASRSAVWQACGKRTSSLSSSNHRELAYGTMLVPIRSEFKLRNRKNAKLCRIVALHIGYNTVGRMRDNDLVAPADCLQVSRRQCAILCHSDGRAEIFDLASLNGTEVNGKRLSDSRFLASGDRVQVGDFSFVVLLGGLN